MRFGMSIVKEFGRSTIEWSASHMQEIARMRGMAERCALGDSVQLSDTEDNHGLIAAFMGNQEFSTWRGRLSSGPVCVFTRIRETTTCKPANP